MSFLNGPNHDASFAGTNITCTAIWRLFDLQIVAYAILVEAGSLPCEPCMD